MEEQTTNRYLNTKYLIDAPPKSPFPWGLCILSFFLLVVMMFGLWMIYEKRKNGNAIIHCVSQGETIRTLALRYYGNSNEWQKIFFANRRKLMKQTELKEGDKIIIPMLTQNAESRNQNAENKNAPTPNQIRSDNGKK